MSVSNTLNERMGGRSLFWPILLIGAGVIWLLANLNVFPANGIIVLFRLWPLLLVAIGLELLVGRRTPLAGTAIAVGVVAIAVVVFVLTPTLGWAQSAEVKTAEYHEAVGDAEAVRINLIPAVASTRITALDDSDDLFMADLHYVGELEYDVQGESEKIITLRQKADESFQTGFWDFGLYINTSVTLNWDVELSPDVPLSLNITGGVGESVVDLRDMQLTNLDISSGVGKLNLQLPAVDDQYPVDVNVGTGESTISIEEGAALVLDIRGGVGAVTVDVPEGAAVRVEASSGVGAINMPSAFERMSGEEDDFSIGSEGVWETAGFDGADRQIIITYSGGVGEFTVR